MKIAIPTVQRKLCMHFGHSELFAIVHVNDETKAIEEVHSVTPPDHAPGVLPRWLAEQGVNVIIAGGMGQRAQALFAQSGIEVVVGAPSDEPCAIVASWLEGTLATGSNVCDH